jgi:hypothetical protein
MTKANQNRGNILWYMDPLLVNDLEINEYTTAVAK